MALRLKETRQATPEEHERFMQDQADFDWLAAHAEEIEREYRGKYIAVVNQELFMGDTYEEVEEKVRLKYPDRRPFVEYIPWTKRILVV